MKVFESRVSNLWKSTNYPLDRKLIVSLAGDEKVDRLPIIVSCNGVDQLLVVPQLTNGTGQAISNAIIQTLYEWNLND